MRSSPLMQSGLGGVLLVSATAALALAVAIALEPTATAAARQCGSVAVSSPNSGKRFRVRVRVRRGSASCRSARWTMRRYLQARCRASEGQKCGKRVGRYFCSYATLADAPRIASCSRGRVVIQAYEMR